MSIRKNKLKIGDKLLCKKSCLINIGNSSFPGDQYDIGFQLDINKYYYITKTSYLNGTIFYFLSDKGTDLDFWCCEDKKIMATHIWDYFYKKNEVLKIKLKKLENCENR